MKMNKRILEEIIRNALSEQGKHINNLAKAKKADLLNICKKLNIGEKEYAEFKKNEDEELAQEKKDREERNRKFDERREMMAKKKQAFDNLDSKVITNIKRGVMRKQIEKLRIKKERWESDEGVALRKKKVEFWRSKCPDEHFEYEEGGPIVINGIVMKFCDNLFDDNAIEFERPTLDLRVLEEDNLFRLPYSDWYIKNFTKNGKMKKMKRIKVKVKNDKK